MFSNTAGRMTPMRHLVLYVACVALIAVCLSACQESLEQRAARESRQYTSKSCPLRVDEFTVMDSMTFVASASTLCYWYTLSDTADRTYTETERQQASALLQKNLHNNTHLKVYREAGYAFRYVYRSASDAQTVRLDITLH
ncbi:MAG: hypothetical protein K5928_04600 [Prevotella sp.]|nr:hypothetical protein [Prevotella sp.]